MTTKNNHKVRKEPSCSCTKQAVKDEFRFQQAEYINRTTVCKFCHIMSLKPEARNNRITIKLNRKINSGSSCRSRCE